MQVVLSVDCAGSLVAWDFRLTSGKVCNFVDMHDLFFSLIGQYRALTLGQ